MNARNDRGGNLSGVVGETRGSLRQDDDVPDSTVAGRTSLAGERSVGEEQTAHTSTTASDDSAPARLSLRLNFSWSFVGNVVYAGSQWGILVLVAKLGSSEMVGRFALSVAIATPIIMFLNLQLRFAQASDAEEHYRFGHYLAVRIITSTLALATISGIALWSELNAGVRLVIFAVGIAKAIDAISDVVYGLLQQHERLDRVALLRIVKGPLCLVAMGTLLGLTGSLFWATIGMSAVSAGVLIFGDFPSARWALGSEGGYVRPEWDSRAIARLILFVLPLGFVSGLHALKNNIPRFYVQYFYGESEVGVFAAIAYFTMITGMFMEALGQAAIPRLSQYYSARRFRPFCILLAKLLAIASFLGAGGILVAAFAAKPIVTMIYSKEFVRDDNLFIWIMLGGALTYIASFVTCGLLATRRYGAMVPLFSILAAISAIACQFLVPSNGALGAAFAIALVGIAHIVFGAIVLAVGLRKHATDGGAR